MDNAQDNPATIQPNDLVVLLDEYDAWYESTDQQTYRLTPNQFAIVSSIQPDGLYLTQPFRGAIVPTHLVSPYKGGSTVKRKTPLSSEERWRAP